MPTSTRGKEKRELWAIRITDGEKEAIRARAQARDMSMTQYVVQAALGELDVDPTDTERRFEDLEDRVGRLERAAELGSFG